MPQLITFAQSHGITNAGGKPTSKANRAALIEALGDRLRALLQGEPAWLALVEAAAAEGRRLVPYSCRHGYALRGSLRGVSIRTLAAQLGHNVATHTQVYGQWIDAESIDAEMAAAAARMALEQAVPAG